jgi:integrase/recombinase XerD
MTIGRHPQPIRRQLYPDRMGDVLEKYINQLGFGEGYSTHFMRATFVTTALENGAKQEDVQRTVGHADPAPTRLYDRWRFMPTKSAALVVSYGDAEGTRI